MFKLKPALFVLLICVICLLISVISSYASEESLTITTYYPSPYGSYNQLQTNSLGVGDVNGDGTLNSSDVPPTTTPPYGDVWIAGKVGIATKEPGSQATLTIRQKADDEYQLFLAQNNQYPGNGWWNGYLLRSDITDGDLSFASIQGGAISEKVRFQSGGNVGIGTSAPSEKLDVAGNIRASGGGINATGDICTGVTGTAKCLSTAGGLGPSSCHESATGRGCNCAAGEYVLGVRAMSTSDANTLTLTCNCCTP